MCTLIPPHSYRTTVLSRLPALAFFDDKPVVRLAATTAVVQDENPMAELRITVSSVAVRICCSVFCRV